MEQGQAPIDSEDWGKTRSLINNAENVNLMTYMRLMRRMDIGNKLQNKGGMMII